MKFYAIKDATTEKLINTWAVQRKVKRTKKPPSLYVSGNGASRAIAGLRVVNPTRRFILVPVTVKETD